MSSEVPEIPSGPTDQSLKRGLALEGVGSLKIDLARQRTGQTVTYRSLGVNPRLVSTIVDGRRLRSLTWTSILLVGLAGLLHTGRSARFKFWFVLLVLVAAAV